MKKLVLPGALALALAAGCGPSGKLSGRIIVVNGDASQASVAALGPVTRAAAVGADGTFLLEGLPDGVYVVEAFAPSTLELRQTGRGEVKGGSGTAGELSFVGAGRITGRVNAPAGVSGAEVFVSGSLVRQRVAEDGSFALEQVPAGTQTLVASREGYQPSYAKVTVPYNAILDNQTLSLSEVAHGSGRISGHAYFFNKTNHAGITVTVEGTLLSTQTVADGSYTLTGVPLGFVNLVASGAGYDPDKEWNVASLQGGEFRAPDLRLYHAVNRFHGTISDYELSPDQKTLVFIGQPLFDTDSYLYQLSLGTTEAPRLLTRVGPYGTSVTLFWQKDSRKAALRFSQAPDLLFALDVGTAAFKAVSTRLYSAEVAVSANKVFFLEGSSASLNPVSGQPNPLLSVFDFGSGVSQTVEKVERSVTAGCNWPNPFQFYAVSSDGRAGYHTPATPGPSELKLYSASGATKLSSAVSCIGFHGDGTTLLALTTAAPTYELVSYSGTAPTTLFSVPLGEVYSYGFSGDDQHAFLYRLSAASYLLEASPVPGGTKATLFTQATSFFAAGATTVQPKGNQFAFRDAAGNVVVKSATGTTLQTYAAPNLTFGFSPLGLRFHVAAGPAGAEDVLINPTVDHAGAPLGKRSAGGGGYYPTPFYSPHELAGVWQADPTVLQLTKFAGLTTELATRLPNRRVAYFSPDDK
ncbi:MAG: carboxypeptidase regulatory-like domain-containing protein, partial [Myxococcaceae bacterium]